MDKIRQVTLVTVLVIFSLTLFGCTDWQKRYKALNVEHENLKGLYDNCMASLDSSSSEKSQMSGELAACQQTVSELRTQLQQLQAGPGTPSTGFEGMDVAYDPTRGTITVTLPNAILFAAGKATLKNDSIRELDTILSVLRERYPGKNIDVVGHTDSDPIRKSSWKDNWELSAQRSLSVLRYLVERGYAEDRVWGVAAGAAHPIAPNDSASGKAKNRRVEIVVHVN